MTILIYATLCIGGGGVLTSIDPIFCVLLKCAICQLCDKSKYSQRSFDILSKLIY